MPQLTIITEAGSTTLPDHAPLLASLDRLSAGACFSRFGESEDERHARNVRDFGRGIADELRARSRG